jgi:hypothetical protein
MGSYIHILPDNVIDATAGKDNAFNVARGIKPDDTTNDPGSTGVDVSLIKDVALGVSTARIKSHQANPVTDSF